MTPKLTLKMKSCANPDYGQYAPVSNPESVGVKDLEQASFLCREYIRKWNLGGGNWPEGKVYKGKKLIATISYNGKINEVGI